MIVASTSLVIKPLPWLMKHTLGVGGGTRPKPLPAAVPLTIRHMLPTSSCITRTPPHTHGETPVTARGCWGIHCKIRIDFSPFLLFYYSLENWSQNERLKIQTGVLASVCFTYGLSLSPRDLAVVLCYKPEQCSPAAKNAYKSYLSRRELSSPSSFKG